MRCAVIGAFSSQNSIRGLEPNLPFRELFVRTGAGRHFFSAGLVSKGRTPKDDITEILDSMLSRNPSLSRCTGSKRCHPTRAAVGSKGQQASTYDRPFSWRADWGGAPGSRTYKASLVAFLPPGSVCQGPHPRTKPQLSFACNGRGVHPEFPMTSTLL